MNLFKSLKVFVLASLLAPSLAFAQAASTLISLKDGKPSPGLAKSWKKSGEGKYEFQLDTTAKIGRDATVTPDFVKASLEPKLGKTHGVKVTPKGASAVDVSYTGDEKAFLEGVSKTRIRAAKSVEIAVGSTVSSGGLRANPTDRAPKDDEVKLTVVDVKDGVITGTAVAVGKKVQGVKELDTMKFKAGTLTAKANDIIFLVPEKHDGGMWMIKASSKK